MEVLAILFLGFVVLLAFAGFCPRLGIGLAILIGLVGVRALAEPDGLFADVVRIFGGMLVFAALMMIAVAVGVLTGRPKTPPPPPQLPRARVISG
jgi:hypothetical protein